MSSNPAARARFRTLMRRPDDRLPLAEAALCIAWEDQGGPAPEISLAVLNELAAGVRPRIAEASGIWGQITILNHYLFDELGFHGNTRQYNIPENSFVDYALATRTGLPITLSVIYMEIGWRLGLRISGVALPGHFLVRCHADDEEIFIDPFQRGRLWTRAECEQQILSAYGADATPLVEQILQPPTNRAIITRMLRNLKNAYVEAGDIVRALTTIERLLLAAPDEVSELRDRGLLRARQGQVHLALVDLERYAEGAPAASDLPVLRLQLRPLAEHVARLN